MRDTARSEFNPTINVGRFTKTRKCITELSEKTNKQSEIVKYLKIDKRLYDITLEMNQCILKIFGVTKNDFKFNRNVQNIQFLICANH